MANLNSPKRSGDGAKKAWHKPTIYILTDYLQTKGSPELKPDPGGAYENEAFRPNNAGKSYKPQTAP